MDILILLGIALFAAFCVWLAWPGWEPIPQQARWLLSLRWAGFLFTVSCAGLLILLFTAGIAAQDHAQPYAP